MWQINGAKFHDWCASVFKVIYYGFLYLGIPAGVIGFVWSPGAGIAIGFLGLIGVITALKGESVSTRQKAAWALITCLALVVEVRAIYKDRDTQFHEYLETLGQITGGDTWVDIGPMRLGGEPLNRLAIVAHGKYPFYGESVEVYDSSGLHFRRPAFPPPAPAALIAASQLRTYYPDIAYQIPLSVPVTSERAQAFEFRIFGRTGMTQESLRLYRSGDTWFTAGEIHRGKEILMQWKDRGFPEDWKLEAPTEPLDPKLSPIPVY